MHVCGEAAAVGPSTCAWLAPFARSRAAGFVPNMSYVQKFAAILAMPYAVLTIFLVYNGSRFLFYRFVYGQRDLKEHLRNAAASVSIALMLMFLFYLFTARTLLGIWECAPAKPDDGKRCVQQSPQRVLAYKSKRPRCNCTLSVRT